MTNSTSEREQRPKDDSAIHEIISEWCGEGTIGVMRHKIVEYIATVRQEERRAAFKESADYIRRQWLAAYPVEVFPEPPSPPAECSRDRISAGMGRHMATKLIEHFEAAAKRTVCMRCKGSGFEGYAQAACSFCGGDGWLLEAAANESLTREDRDDG